jgi:hypothetical protein
VVPTTNATNTPSFQIVAFSLIVNTTMPLQRRQEREYLKNLNNFLDQSEFYFSLDYDITRRVQHIVSMTAAERAQPLWQRVDDRFFWNKHISRSFIEAKVTLPPQLTLTWLGLAFMSYCFYFCLSIYRLQLDEWILPVMDGFIHVEVCEVGGLIFDYILMSRRSCFRTGIHPREISSIPPAHADNGPLTLIDCINRCSISDARR